LPIASRRRSDALPHGEIAGDRPHGDAERGERLSRLVERCVGPDHEIVVFLRHDPRELEADARGCAGDEREF
jgi:hypothetical protein